MVKLKSDARAKDDGARGATMSVSRGWLLVLLLQAAINVTWPPSGGVAVDRSPEEFYPMDGTVPMFGLLPAAPSGDAACRRNEELIELGLWAAQADMLTTNGFHMAGDRSCRAAEIDRIVNYLHEGEPDPMVVRPLIVQPAIAARDEYRRPQAGTSADDLGVVDSDLIDALWRHDIEQEKGRVPQRLPADLDAQHESDVLLVQEKYGFRPDENFLVPELSGLAKAYGEYVDVREKYEKDSQFGWKEDIPKPDAPLSSVDLVGAGSKLEDLDDLSKWFTSWDELGDLSSIKDPVLSQAASPNPDELKQWEEPASCSTLACSSSTASELDRSYDSASSNECAADIDSLMPSLALGSNDAALLDPLLQPQLATDIVADVERQHQRCRTVTLTSSPSENEIPPPPREPNQDEAFAGTVHFELATTSDVSGDELDVVGELSDDSSALSTSQTGARMAINAALDAGRTTGDHQLALHHRLPLTVEQIVLLPLAELRNVQRQLTPQQATVMRQIRRRGRNAEAAKKCRQRRAQKQKNVGQLHGKKLR